MSDHSHLSEEEQEAALRSQIGNRTPFEVPKDYFESFPTKVQERYTTPRKPAFAWKIWVPVGALASILLAMVFLSFPVSDPLDSPLTAEEIQEYLEQEAVDDLDWVVAEVLTDEEITELIADPNVGAEDLEDLFLEDQINLSDVAEPALEF